MASDANRRIADDNRLRETIVKEALDTLEWSALEAHLTEIQLNSRHLQNLSAIIRRHSDLILKYPNKKRHRKREDFLKNLSAYVAKHVGVEAQAEIESEAALTALIEQGYHNIVAALNACDISKQPAPVRCSGSISRACYEYQDLIRRRDKTLAETKQLTLSSGFRVQADDGTPIMLEAVLDGLSVAIALTLVMEAHKNEWFIEDIVVLPDIPPVTEQIRQQSGSTQVLALLWRQWHRLEKRRRYLGGDLRSYAGSDRPSNLPPEISTLVVYQPHEDGIGDGEVFDYLANTRLRERLTQMFFEMEFEQDVRSRGVGIANGAQLPPSQIVSIEEAHAAVCLSELLGYSITDDQERPAGLRLIEWVRGYTVLREIARERSKDYATAPDSLTILMDEAELLKALESCGLKKSAAGNFIKLVSLHRSSRDMLDCPLVRVASSRYMLFAPALLDLNVALVVLSNLSNRGEQLGRKGKAFERSIAEFFARRGMKVYAFSVTRNGEEYEYDAVLPWGPYLFVFECKNRSLSGGDPAQAYYFDLEVTSQAKQAKRLAIALETFPDIVEQKIGAEHAGKIIVACVLHSLPYARIGDVDGVYFADASAVMRFFNEQYLRIKVPHRIGDITLLHRTAVRQFWKGEAPTPEEFLEQLQSPFQLELLSDHLDVSPLRFPLSQNTLAATHELTLKEFSVHSVCESVGVNADVVLQEIDLITKGATEVRSALEGRAASNTKLSKGAITGTARPPQEETEVE